MKTGNLPRPEVDALLARMRQLRAEASGGALSGVATDRREFAGMLDSARSAASSDTDSLSGRPVLSAMTSTRPSVPTGVGPAAEFQSVFGRALDQVSALGHASSAAKSGYLKGEGVSLVDAMVASSKADVAFQATTQVRNRLVSAYEDIMNMPI